MGHPRGGYYLTYQGHGIYYNQPYTNQPFQGAWNYMEKNRLPFLVTLNFPNLLKLTNDPLSRDPMRLVVPANLPSEIPKFEGKSG